MLRQNLIGFRCGNRGKTKQDCAHPHKKVTTLFRLINHVHLSTEKKWPILPFVDPTKLITVPQTQSISAPKKELL